MSNYFDRAGKPMSMLEWTEAFEQRDKKRVRFDELPLGKVSTVWLGLDHQFGDGPPLIFETMVFDGPLDQECERYSTEEQAIAGHEQMVARVKALDQPKSGLAESPEEGNKG